MLAEGERAVAARAWGRARSRLRSAARLVGEDTALETVFAVGDALERLEMFGEAFRLLAEGGRRLTGASQPEWDGRPLRTGSLLIEQRIRDIGAPIRQARLAAQAATIAPGCTLLINPRLRALFQRSLPEVEVAVAGADDLDARGRAGAIASFETLAYRLTPTPAAAKARFRPLTPDPQTRARFRERWKGESRRRPLIGISWTSTKKNKDLAPLEDWGRFLSAQGCTFVSLQYGEVDEDLRTLRRNGGAVLDDPEVQPLGDLDVFAAQVAALDAVVTVSNTTAHMAGALGMDVFTLLGDQQILSWPAARSRSPWYPGMRLVRPRGGGWASAFSEVGLHLALRRAARGWRAALDR